MERINLTFKQKIKILQNNGTTNIGIFLWIIGYVHFDFNGSENCMPDYYFRLLHPFSLIGIPLLILFYIIVGFIKGMKEDKSWENFKLW